MSKNPGKRTEDVDPAVVLAIQTTSLARLHAQDAILAGAQTDYAKIGGTSRDLKALTDAVSSHLRGAAALLAEVRKQDESTLKGIQRMTMERKVDLLLGMLDELPLEQRRRVAERLVELGGGLL